MKELCLIVQKEMMNFKARRAMLRWYASIIIMNLFFVFLPRYPQINTTQNKGLLCLGFMAFSVFLVPNNLSLDLVGGEKCHCTLETLISSPVDIRKVFLAKVLFIEMLGVISIIVISILDNAFLIFLYHTSFLSEGITSNGLIAIYVMLAGGILFVAVVGSYIAFRIGDLKAGGYIISLVDIGLTFLITQNFKKVAPAKAIETAILGIAVILLLLFASIRYLRKPNIMEKMKG